VRKPLGEPTLHALGGDGDQFGGERVGKWPGEDDGEGVGQGGGALGPVNHEHGPHLLAWRRGHPTEVTGMPRSSEWREVVGSK